jgi:photosystem II stability/assembly factor-like uncharacterized protein
MKSFIFLFAFQLLISIAEVSAQNSADFETGNITTHTIVASSFISDSEGWVADDAGILRYTNNAGDTWTSLGTEKFFKKLDFTNALNGFAIASNTAYKTVNGGITWSALTMPGSIGTALYFLDSNTGLISGNGEVYKTTNGGTSWASVSTEGVSFVDYYFVSSSIGIAVANDGEAHQSIWRTTDGGSGWTNVYHEENYVFNAVWFISETTGFAAGYYTMPGRGKLPVIHRTTDGGVTWKKIYLNTHPGSIRGQEFIAIRFKNELEGIAIAGYSENVITHDGGLAWQLTDGDEEDIIASYGIYNILDGVNTLYLMGKNGTVTKWE